MPSSRTTLDATPPRAVDLEAIANVNRRSALAMAEMNRRMFRAMLNVQSEILEFTHRRLAEDVAAARMLADCRQAESAVKLVQAFHVKAMEDYAREAGELMRIGVVAASDLARDAAVDLADAATDGRER
jgi:hypothetical protein